MTRTPSRSSLILDTCVLIDFFKVDRTVLRLAGDAVGPLYVASTLIEEMGEIERESEITDLGMEIIVPETEDAYRAAEMVGRTSFYDNLCCLVARRNGWTCVTNDKNLRKRCTRENVPLLWGLELLTMIYRAEELTAEEAEAIARGIQRANPKHITEGILERFRRNLDEGGRDRSS